LPPPSREGSGRRLKRPCCRYRPARGSLADGSPGSTVSVIRSTTSLDS
jgi:hypothetical protein